MKGLIDLLYHNVGISSGLPVIVFVRGTFVSWMRLVLCRLNDRSFLHLVQFIFLLLLFLPFLLVLLLQLLLLFFLLILVFLFLLRLVLLSLLL